MGFAPLAPGRSCISKVLVPWSTVYLLITVLFTYYGLIYLLLLIYILQSIYLLMNMALRFSQDRGTAGDLDTARLVSDRFGSALRGSPAG